MQSDILHPEMSDADFARKCEINALIKPKGEHPEGTEVRLSRLLNEAAARLRLGVGVNRTPPEKR